MHQSIEKAFADAREVFDYVKDAQALGKKDNPLLSILSTAAVDALGALSLHARDAASKDKALRTQFQQTAQTLIDFLESQGHANIIKEWGDIQRITPYFPTLRVPKVFKSDSDSQPY